MLAVIYVNKQVSEKLINRPEVNCSMSIFPYFSISISFLIFQANINVQDLGIDPSLIRSHYEPPIDTVASSRKNKSCQGITIRKNKQPVSIGQSSNSHVNRTDSAHSNNARSASNMIPCFPANNSTDVHHCDIVSSRSSPSHFTKDAPLNISQVRTRSTTKKKKTTAWKIKKVSFEK